ncbi:MAG: hypothetical protein K2M17_00240 [Bacilli bacterium]|nr:hypothetical protein [Bacilli bacterium]
MEKIKIKNEKFFKSKLQMVIYSILFVILIALFIYIGAQDYNSSIPDNERFANEYRIVGKNNVFKYINVMDARMIAGGKKGIVFLGNASSQWAEYYASLVNEVAKEVGIETIYYYDFFKDREQNNATYNKMVETLNDYIIKDDLGRTDIYAPSLLVVSNDKILMFDTDTSFVLGNSTPANYWNYERRLEKMNELRAVFRTYLES